MPVQTSKEAKQSLVNQLDSLGVTKEIYDAADVLTAAESDVADFIERVRSNIASADLILSGKIEELSIKVTANGIEILGNEYLLYQDRGVQGSESGEKAPNSPHKYTDKMPPLQVFVDYIKRKNLNLRNQSQFFEGESPFKELSEEELVLKAARAMQVYIFKYGFKPRKVFAKEIPQLREDLKKSIKGFAKDSIREVFRFKK